MENEFEKADRLMEVFFQYQRRFKAALERLKRRDDMDQDEDMDAELRDAGHFMLQQVRRPELADTLHVDHAAAPDTQAHYKQKQQRQMRCVEHLLHETAKTSFKWCQRAGCRKVEMQNTNMMMMRMYLLPGICVDACMTECFSVNLCFVIAFGYLCTAMFE